MIAESTAAHAFILSGRREAGTPLDECRPPAPRRGLRPGAPDVLGSGTFGTIAHLELHAVALSQIGDPFTVDGALVNEVVLPLGVLDEPESLSTLSGRMVP